ncbi:uncharacterized protein LOC103580911 [Microplitis demolitor]|uniref:uncharacterized protein LOC103580911 n=1 Tax=Microplitis demolitor TaxID=69319 RepID=UPI0004CC9E53|nr:uncharacterized protein LOC103580911 [Microplitis demolitor]
MMAQYLNVEQASLELLNNFEKLLLVNGTDSEVLENNRIDPIKKIISIFEKIIPYDSCDDKRDFRVESEFYTILDNLSLMSEWKTYEEFYINRDRIHNQYDVEVNSFFFLYEQFSTAKKRHFGDYSADDESNDPLNFILRHSTSINKSSERCAHNLYDIQINFWKIMTSYDIYRGKQPVYNKLHDFYEDVLIAVCQAYTTLFLSYELSKPKQYHDSLRNQLIIFDDFKKNLLKIIETGHYYVDAMNKTEYRIYKKCDSDKWSKGKNYIRIENYVDSHSDSDNSIHTISLKEYYTNSSDNRVVTGIRFAVEKNILTIQIQEGQLINGIIDPDSLRCTTDDDYPSDEQDPKTVRLDYKIQGFNLDDIELPEGQFVTGVKFVLTKNDRISLAVRGSTMYDNKIGILSPPVENQWHYPSEINSTLRSNIDVNYPKNPTDLKLLTTEISKSGQHYINLSMSTFSSSNDNDAMVLLLDSRPVKTKPPSGIGGLGLFYTGHSGCSGFLAFKYFSSQFKPYSRLPIHSIISNMKTPEINS